MYIQNCTFFQHGSIIQPLSDVKLSHSILFNIFTGVGEIFDRVVIEVIQKMKEMKMVSFANIRAYLNIEQFSLLNLAYLEGRKYNQFLF